MSESTSAREPPSGVPATAAMACIISSDDSWSSSPVRRSLGIPSSPSIVCQK